MSDPAPSSFADRRLAMLQRLAELGMILAERLAAEGEPSESTAMQFARVAKAVRQTLALEAQLAGELELKAARLQAPIKVTPWERRGITQEQYEAEDAAGEKLGDAELLIDRAIDKDPRESLRDELRADAYDLIEELEEAGVFASATPAAQIIARIADRLGLAPDWSGFSEQDWREVEHRIRADLKSGKALFNARADLCRKLKPDMREPSPPAPKKPDG